MYQPLYEVLCISRDINSKLEMDLIKRAASYNENMLLYYYYFCNWIPSREEQTLYILLTMAKTEFLEV